VPIRAEQESEEVSGFAAEVAERVVAVDPRRLSSNAREHEREGKVLVEHRRNGFGQTVVAPYALRALPGTPVATPLEWDELGAPGKGPRDHTMSSVFTRLAREGDPWKGMASCSAPLPRLGNERAEIERSTGAASIRE
jgi:bifunctional non-homologous end joining protein LigD